MGPVNHPSILSRNVESFALDLVRLIRIVRVYPPQHPSLLGMAERVIAAAPLDSTGVFTIGVTPTELFVCGEFVGGKASSLASFLHTRKVLRIFWGQGVRSDDIWTFARLLSTPRVEGVELRRRLHSEGVFTIDLDPLAFDQIHGEIEDGVTDSQSDPKTRGRQAWISMMNHETPPEQIASALASEQFWLDAKEAWTTAGVVDSEGFTELLLDLGERFEVALSLLPDQQRETVLSYLAKMGKSLSINDLVRILAREKREPITFGQVTVSLLQEISGERFVDLLAGLAALDNQGTRRLVEVFRLFTPAVAVSDLLDLVKTRLSQGQDSGFAVEVWRTVEDFVLKLIEDPFMDQDYSKSLEDITDSSNIMPQAGEQSELLSDPDEYLDHVVLGLAMEGQDDWREKLLHRIESRVEQLEVVRILEFVRLVDGVFPKLMDSRPLLLRNLFKKGLATLAMAKTKEQEALIDFTLSHEGTLLDAALKALEEEKQISKRHFIVRLLASFSPASTPVFVLKARYGPWYLARNLAIVLSEQGASQGLPTLRALSKHPHPKVKKEAIRALRKVQSLQGNLSSQTSEEGAGSRSNNPDTLWSELPPNTNRVLP